MVAAAVLRFVPVVVGITVGITLMCTGAATVTFVDILTAATGLGAPMIMSKEAVDLWMDVALSCIMRGVLANTGGGVFVEFNVKVFAVVMTAFAFAIPCLLEKFRC